jgi:hypothetical protein
MVLLYSLLCWIGLYTVWGNQLNHPMVFRSSFHQPQNPVESGISYIHFLYSGQVQQNPTYRQPAVVGARRNAINDAADCRIIRIAFMEIVAELLNQVLSAKCLFKFVLQPLLQSG